MSSATKDTSGTIIDTIQSLLVAFVLAMLFRGFVIEGFVIPTGSMAPTLMGRHVLVESKQTGSVTPVGLDTGGLPPNGSLLRDYLAGRDQRFDRSTLKLSDARWGDRILVSKWLYPFTSPTRWDPIVFKNPAQPEGAVGTYIKRLVGLPGESIWIIDGDLFVQSEGEAFRIARKPPHMRARVWQPVWSSRMLPATPGRLPISWKGMPWKGDPASDWTESGHRLLSDTSDPVRLVWDSNRFPIDDWTAYNMFAPVSGDLPVSDVRVAATLTPQATGLQAAFELKARSHVIRYELADGLAKIEMWPQSDPDNVTRMESQAPVWSAGQPVRFVAEHVDQAARLILDGVEVVELEYDWSPRQRLEAVAGMGGPNRTDDELARRRPSEAMLSWEFRGAPVELSTMSLDRDLFYRPAVLTSLSRRHEPVPEYEGAVVPGAPAAGTHPDSIVHLGPDQYFVLGDNSGRSLDGRLWGAPDPIVAEQFDDTPFVVHEDLLIGKAFAVYLPSPHNGLVPDFGRLRFIH